MILALALFFALALSPSAEATEAEELLGIYINIPSAFGIRARDGSYVPATFKVFIRPYEEYLNPTELAAYLRANHFSYDIRVGTPRAYAVVVYIDEEAVFKHVSVYNLDVANPDGWAKTIEYQHRE